MSARTEALIQEIKDIEAEIVVEQASLRSVTTLRWRLIKRQRELTRANEALTEGKQILKD